MYVYNIYTAVVCTMRMLKKAVAYMSETYSRYDI